MSKIENLQKFSTKKKGKKVKHGSSNNASVECHCQHTCLARNKEEIKRIEKDGKHRSIKTFMWIRNFLPYCDDRCSEQEKSMSIIVYSELKWCYGTWGYTPSNPQFIMYLYINVCEQQIRIYLHSSPQWTIWIQRWEFL